MEEIKVLVTLRVAERVPSGSSIIAATMSTAAVVLVGNAVRERVYSHYMGYGPDDPLAYGVTSVEILK